MVSEISRWIVFFVNWLAVLQVCQALCRHLSLHSLPRPKFPFKLAPKRIPSSFSSKAIRDGDFINAGSATKLSATKIPHPRVGASSSKVRSTALSSRSKAVKVRSDNPTVLVNQATALAAMAKMNKNKGASPYGTTLTRVDSAAPTALIAPNDYEHIFKGEPKGGKATKVAKRPSDALGPVNSEAPTALIAPADYQHIFKGEQDSAGKKKGAKEASKTKAGRDKRIPSDAPTALIEAVRMEDQKVKKQPAAPKQVVSKVKVGDPSKGGSTSRKNQKKNPPAKAAADKPEPKKVPQSPKPESESSGCCCCVLM